MQERIEIIRPKLKMITPSTPSERLTSEMIAKIRTIWSDLLIKDYGVVEREIETKRIDIASKDAELAAYLLELCVIPDILQKKFEIKYETPYLPVRRIEFPAFSVINPQLYYAKKQKNLERVAVKAASASQHLAQQLAINALLRRNDAIAQSLGKKVSS